MATYKRDFILSGGIGLSANNIYLSSATNSTTISTGALILSGGAGIAQSLSIGGSLQIFNGSNFTAFKASSASNNIYTLPNQYPAIGTSVLQSNTSGEMSWAPMIASSSSGNTTQNIAINTAGNANVFHPVLLTPSALSAGSAVSADTTITYNPSTEILYVSGLAITAQTASTSSTLGALVVSGGVGIGGSLYVASATGISGVTINNGVVTGNLTGTASTATYAHQAGYAITSGSASIATTATYAHQAGYAITSGSASIATTATNINVSNATTNAAHPMFFGPTATGSGVAVSSNTTLSYNPSSFILSTSGLAVTATTISTNTLSGALVVSGGVGIGGSIFVGGDVFISSATASTSADNGALRVQGGLGVSGQLSFNQAALGYTGASNPSIAFIGGTTGTPITMTVLSDNSLVFEGTSGKLFGINNNLSSGWIFNVGDISGIPLLRANADGTVAMAEFAGNVGIGLSNPAYKLHVTGSVGFTSSVGSSTVTTGALIVSGGVGIGNSLSVGGRLQLFNGSNFIAFVSSATGNTVYTLPATSPATGSSVLSSTSGGVLSWVPMTSGSSSGTVNAGTANFAAYYATSTSAVSENANLQFTGTGLSVGGNINSSSTKSGALYVNGGLGVTGNAFIGGTINAPSINQSNISNVYFTNGNITGTSVTATTIQGTLVGTATTSTNVHLASTGNVAGPFYLAMSSGSSGAGLALSSDTALSYNSATDVLTVSNISGAAITASTSFSGPLFGDVTGTATTATYSHQSGYGITAGIATTATNINVVSANTSALHYILLSPNATGSGVAVSSNTTLSYNPSSFILSTSGLAVTATTISTNAASGALVVSGGVGIGGSLYVGDTSRFEANTASVSTSTGAVVVSGGVGVGGSLYVGGSSRFSDSSQSNTINSGAIVVTGGAGIAQSVSIGGRLQLFNGANYTSFVSSASGNTVYTLPATSPAIGTSYLVSTSAGVMSWIRPKRSYVLSFGAGFTPIANAADTIQLNIPYAPDNVSLNYFVKRIEYRNETLSGGTGLSFYLQRHTSGNASWTTTNTITAGSGASFEVGASTYASTFTTISSSSCIAGSVISGDYVRLFFTTVGYAADVSISMIIEEQ